MATAHQHQRSWMLAAKPVAIAAVKIAPAPMATPSRTEERSWMPSDRHERHEPANDLGDQRETRHRIGAIELVLLCHVNRGDRTRNRNSVCPQPVMMYALDLSVGLRHVRPAHIGENGRPAGCTNVVVEIRAGDPRDPARRIHRTLNFHEAVERRYADRITVLQQEVVPVSGIVKHPIEVDADASEPSLLPIKHDAARIRRVGESTGAL